MNIESNIKDNEEIAAYVPTQQVEEIARTRSKHEKFVIQRLRNLLSDRHWGGNEFRVKLNQFSNKIIELNSLDFAENFAPTLDDSRISNIKNQKKYSINSEDYRIIVYFLDFHGLLLPGHFGDEIGEQFPDPLFHSLIDFMDIGEYTFDNIIKRAPGLYHAYRPSSTFPDHFWVGALEIFVNRETKAVVAKEFYTSNDFDGRPNKTIKFYGYLVRKARHYTIISKNESAASLSVALLPYVTVEDNKIMSLAGAILDMSTGRLWGGRVLYERAELPLPDTYNDTYREYREQFLASSRVAHESEIPASILRFFKGDDIPNLTIY